MDKISSNILSVFNSMSHAIIIKDEKGLVQIVNSKFCEYFLRNKTGDDILGKPYIVRECEYVSSYEGNEVCLINEKGDIIRLFIDEKDIYNDKGNITGNFSKFLSIDELQLDEFKKEEIELAEVDYLTGLSNRRGLYSYYNSLDKKSCMHFMFIDIDNFKIVNDVYGHSIGDDLLIMVGNVIKDCAPEAFVSRIGGDEFVLILSGTLSEGEVENIAKSLIVTIAVTKFRQDVLSNISFSIGIILDQKTDIKLDAILYKCDSAMYQAKENGKNQYLIFNRMEEQVRERKRIEEEMNAALSNGEFKVYLQPKMNMITSSLYGAEALVRWEHPKDGLRMPGKFIPVFERNGFIVDLDMHVFEEVCKIKKHWKDTKKEYKGIIVSVNMSRLHFFRDNFVDCLLEIAKKYKINTNELEIEITESIFLKNSEAILEVVKKLKEEGFFVSIDDFGSGYSSLNMLKDIPADMLKIDREFLKISNDNEKSITVIKNVIIMGKDLKLEVIAEGVEELSQALFLSGCGCELAQGFYYSKALPVHEFDIYAKENRIIKERIIKFAFKNDITDHKNGIEAKYIGTGFHFDKGVTCNCRSLYFPGGKRNENVLNLPVQVFGSESYTIALWVKCEKIHGWTSIFYTAFENGFISIVPYAWDGAAAFRIKDDRDVSGWYDTTCRSLAINEWTYLVVTFEAKSGVSRIYLNGRYSGFTENVPTLRIPKTVLLGGDIFQESFQGYICEFTIYDRAKSTQDIRQMYDKYQGQISFRGERM